ncbi:hypothetical protein [Microlunatus sp. GCM10028923]
MSDRHQTEPSRGPNFRRRTLLRAWISGWNRLITNGHAAATW